MIAPHHDEYALDFLDDEAKGLVKEMLHAVAEHPNVYPNGFMVTRSKRGDGSFEYYLATQGGPGPFRNHQRLPSDITDLLVHYGFAERKRDSRLASQFRSFTDAALEWQRRYGGSDSNEIRKRIGRVLRANYGGSVRDYPADEMAAEIGIDADLVREQTRILLGAGLIDRVMSRDRRDLGMLSLSNPAGILWA